MPRKATTKAPKKAEPKAAKPEAIEPKPAEIAGAGTPDRQREPEEPELNAAEVAATPAGDELPAPAPLPIASEGESEALAEAADTFDQAYEDRAPLQHYEPAALDVDVPQSAAAGKERDSQSPAAGSAAEPEERAGERPPARLERLQKILSQAGIASRRHAEEMITQGLVQVNGKVVTELGSKADPERDHIRVNGKLIHGAERLRYFVLNKPRGYVTTVSDPEGRPTVMEFFRKMSERLYPVGRLDYQSEGLLLVTNDGDLANKLTKAATGVEKIYLVKVSGQPTPEELDRLREGVVIHRTQPGEGRVRTAPAMIREARPGDNPWYEVVLTEGRNRELRKMFEEIGHHVEKIRRVGYGPLVLDVEPGQLRELDADELTKLRLAAEGKWRKPKTHAAPASGSRRQGGPAKDARPQGRGGQRRYEEPSGKRGREDRRRGGERPGPQRGGERRYAAERPEPPGRHQGLRGQGYAGERQQRGEDRRAPAERPERRRPPQRDQDDRPRRGTEVDRPRRESFGQAKASGGRGAGFARNARPFQGGKPERRRPEWETRGGSREERPSTGSRYRENRPASNPRFDGTEARRGAGGRAAAFPPQDQSGTSQGRFASRPGRPAFGRGKQGRSGESGQSAGGTGARGSSRPDRSSGPSGRRPPFKKAAGPGGKSRDNSSARGGPRRRRD